MTDLEKLYNEKSGANFVIPSSSHGGYDKVSLTILEMIDFHFVTTSSY